MTQKPLNQLTNEEIITILKQQSYLDRNVAIDYEIWRLGISYVEFMERNLWSKLTKLNEMEENEMAINYNEEVKKLDSFVPGQTSKFWKPKAGQYKVKSLTDLEEADPYKEQGKEDKPQVKIDLLVGDEKATWTMAKGKSPASTYGQMCKLALTLGGSLVNKEFLVVVTFDGKKNTYTIVKI